MTPEDRELGERLAAGFGPDEAELDDMESRVAVPSPQAAAAPRGLGWALALTGAAVVVAMVGLTLVPPSMPDPLQQVVLSGTPPPPQAPADAPHNFSAERGTEVVRGDFRLALAPGGVRDAQGAVVDGTVTLSWSLDPEAAPPLVTAAGTPLEAAAVLEVSLHRGGTEPLGWDGVAEVDLPVPEGAGDLDLYHYDEGGGAWVPEGEGRREGGVFRAELLHFSWWAAATEGAATAVERVPEAGDAAPTPPSLRVIPSPQAPPHLPLRLERPERQEGPQVVLPMIHDDGAVLPGGAALRADLDDLAEELEGCAPEPGWTGVVLVRWELRDGRARDVVAASAPRSVGTCVERSVRGWRFDPGSHGTVDLPFAFHPRED